MPARGCAVCGSPWPWIPQPGRQLPGRDGRLGKGRVGARIADVFGGAASIQGLEPGSSPTSGMCFHCSGACGPLSVHKLFNHGPLRGPCLLVAVASFRVWVALSLVVCSWSAAASAGLHSLVSRLFMTTFSGKRMTVCVLLTGSAPRGGAEPGPSDETCLRRTPARPGALDLGDREGTRHHPTSPAPASTVTCRPGPRRR